MSRKTDLPAGLGESARFPVVGQRTTHHRRHQTLHVVQVRRTELRSQGNASRIDPTWYLLPFFPRSVGLVRYRPPEDESMGTRDQSNWPALSKRLNSSPWILSQVSFCCHLLRRRQQVMPLPELISWGSSFQGMPVFSTNKMPVMPWRCEMRGRPP